MRKYTIEYKECYNRFYEVEANSSEEAKEILIDDLSEGRVAFPDNLYDSSFEIYDATESKKSTLAKLIAENEIDKIEDDEKFMLRENELIREYCIDNNFQLSDDDMAEITNRGLASAYDDWKFEFENK